MNIFEKFAKFHDYFEINYEWKDKIGDHDDNIKCDLSWLQIKHDVLYLSMSIQNGDFYIYLDTPLSNKKYRQKVLDDFSNSEISSINSAATYIKIGNMNNFEESDIKKISENVKKYIEEYENEHNQKRVTFSMLNRIVLIHTKIKLGTFPNCNTLLDECRKDSNKKNLPFYNK